MTELACDCNRENREFLRRLFKRSQCLENHGLDASPRPRLSRKDTFYRLLATMPKTPDELLAFLSELGIAGKSLTHPPLFTVADSQALRGKIPGGHTKNLFLRDKKDRYFLLTVEE